MTTEELLALSNKENVSIRLNLLGYGGWALILVGGAITTMERFDNFDVSLAYLYEDGRIKCFGRVIGSVRDIEVMNVIEGETTGPRLLTDGGA